MLILGIDPGLNITGYGIIEDKNDLKFVDAGYIKTASNQSIEKRLLKIYNSLNELIKKYKLQAIVLEKLYAHYKHPVTACLLGHARGAICLAGAQNNIELFEYGATRIRKAITGKGNSSKLQIQQMALHILDLKPTNKMILDVTDALAVAIAHHYIEKGRARL